MTTQDTENQVGGAEPQNDTIVGTEPAPDSPDAPDSDNATDGGEPQPDAPPTSAEKLHAAAVAYIIAARVAGVDAHEYLTSKIAEIAD